MWDTIYQGKRVFLTGHNSFKGSWMSLWLRSIGAEVTGYAIEPPTQPNHFDLLKLDLPATHGDLRDFEVLRKAMRDAQPDIVFHMAAQSSVLESYRRPLETFATNVMGTAHVLEAAREVPSLRAVVIVTTDKCYENHEWVWGYRETDALGGHDPYSSSKALAELAVASYRRSFFPVAHYGSAHQVLLATVRSGNIVGGGDWKEDRIVPDVMRAVTQGRKTLIRNPESTRPWQHVLEPVNAYLLLGKYLIEGRKEFSGAWNFGPADDANRTVLEVVQELQKSWPQIDFEIQHPRQTTHEAKLLKLDCSKARAALGWRAVWSFADTMKRTAEWYREYHQDRAVISSRQLAEFKRELETDTAVPR
jgi:CDP-glucose 4,6-dehydratase